MKFTQLLSDLGRVVGYYPSLTKLTGSVNASLFLCQMLYWTARTHDEEGWIYKTQLEWEEEVGLSRYEQEYARKVLKKLGFLHEQYRECPRKLFYRLDLDAIDEAYESKFPNKNAIERKNRTIERGKTTYKHAVKPHPLHTEITSEITSEKKDFRARDEFKDERSRCSGYPRKGQRPVYCSMHGLSHFATEG